MQAVGATKAQASALTDRLREELLKTGKYTLVDRSQMSAILNEQALQQSGCTSTECAVQVGQVLGVRKIVTSKVIQAEAGIWLLSAQLIDVETAQTLNAVSVQYKGGYFPLLSEGIGKLVAKLTGSNVAAAAAPPEQPKAAPPPTPPPPPVATRPPHPKPPAEKASHWGAYLFGTLFAVAAIGQARKASRFNNDAKATALTDPASSQLSEVNRDRAVVWSAAAGTVAGAMFLSANTNLSHVGSLTWATVLAAIVAQQASRAIQLNNQAKDTSRSDPASSQYYEDARNRSVYVASLAGLVTFPLLIAAITDGPSASSADSRGWRVGPGTMLADNALVPSLRVQLRW